MQAGVSSHGLFGSLRKCLDPGLGIVHHRVELFAVEFKEQKSQLVELVLCLSIALFLAMLAMIVLTGTIILIFPAEYRVYAAGGLCFLYIIGASIAFARFKSKLRDSQLPFSETINEVRKDREWLQTQK